MRLASNSSSLATSPAPSSRPRLATACATQRRHAPASATAERRRRLSIASAQASDARGAIDAGIALMEAGDPRAALAEFGRALTLPGTGLKRYRDKPPTLTEGERAAALYNTACAHASLGDKRAALDALGAAVGEAGFADGRGAAADEDLAPLRGDPAFEALVGRLRAAQEREEEQQQKKKGFLGGLFG